MAQPLLYHCSVLCCRVHSTLVYCPEFRKEKLCIPCNSVLEMPCSFMYPCLTKPRSVAGSSAAFLPSFSSKLSVFVPYLFLTVTFLNVTTPPRENQPRLFKHLLFFFIQLFLAKAVLSRHIIHWGFTALISPLYTNSTAFRSRCPAIIHSLPCVSVGFRPGWMEVKKKRHYERCQDLTTSIQGVFFRQNRSEKMQLMNFCIWCTDGSK